MTHLHAAQVWVPAIYSSPGIYLVKHPIALGWCGSAAILFLGVLSIWANYDADRQRHAFRQVRHLLSRHYGSSGPSVYTRNAG